MKFCGRRVAARVSAFAAVALICGMLSAWAPSHGPAGPYGSKVLLVGTFDGKAGRYQTIQSAVDAARPGDWILVGPGDYHETADESGRPINPGNGQMGGVYIAKSGITVRGMDRNSVVVDGTNPGSPPCSSKPSAQNYGSLGPDGVPVGRNGIVVWKANDVRVQNLTVCNFLAGTGASGNEIWWNGGDGSGKIGLTGYWGSYLTATSTFFSSETTAARVRHLRQQLGRPGRLESALRQQHERLRHVRRRLPAAVRRNPEPHVDGEQRPRVLGHQLRRDHRH